MKLKKRYRILFAVLALCILLTAMGVVYLHGEWWFPLTQRMRRFKTPALTEVLLQDTRKWDLEDLIAQENVSYSTVLMLVNADHPLPADYTPELIEYNGAKMHPKMRDPYIAMRDDIQKKTNVRIYVASDYRTPEEQESIIADSADGIAANLGCSEHEAGLALDVYAPHCDGMRFLRSPAGREVNRVCADYGYIIRYPQDKTDITGIAYEPWHVRYVGQPHARIMTDAGLTLEEYLDQLTPNVWYQSGDDLIARLPPDALLLPAEFATCEISPDNTGYYIVTVKK
ncbi:MAG: D-alanyl-D-alanine carboxypeptidase family protein [Ruminococcaceae bacterium]|nr:D-alanyl-D-alanine carboxypeptidase family protein [Oscillospiraceae bacterium]